MQTAAVEHNKMDVRLVILLITSIEYFSLLQEDHRLAKIKQSGINGIIMIKYDLICETILSRFYYNKLRKLHIN